ncbi:glycosyltransferase [Micromonospora sp. L31]|uniref:glycosyltransferase n=1 Tax=Micromonospora sp. L31 TaxID=3452213 RepID=UPI003F89335A
MAAEQGPVAISDLVGAERRAVAEELWQKWRFEGRGAALLFGFAGVGKSDQVVRPLRNWAASQSIPTAWVDVPVGTADVATTIGGRILEELKDGGHPGVAATVSADATLADILRSLLAAGALVVIDEFQRLLDPQGKPSASMARMLEQLARRPTDRGCLLLVSNRHLDWTWTEHFHVTELLPPDDADAITIVLDHLGAQQADARFPHHRRPEVVRRLGRNPRVLRLLGYLLKSHLLEGLLPPSGSAPEEPFDSKLVEEIERTLLAKAAEGLPESTRAFLRDMSVIRDWADWDLIEAMGGGRGEVRELVRGAQERYLLQARTQTDRPGAGPAGRYQVHPLLREADGVQLRRDGAAWRAAHARAGDWYARKLQAAGRTEVHDRTLLLGLDGAAYHYTAADAEEALLTAIEPARRYIGQRYGWMSVRVNTVGERDARIALLELYNSRWGTPGTHYHLAMLLRDRGRPEDLSRAVPQAESATLDQDHADPWVLWAKLVWAVDGTEAAIAVAREATAHVAPAKSLFSVYQQLGGYLNERRRAGEAIAALREGVDRARGNTERLAALAAQYAAGAPTDDLLEEVVAWLREKPELEVQYRLAQVYLLERGQRWHEALALLADGRRLSPRYINFSVHEALCHLALGDAVRAQEAVDNYPAQKSFSTSSASTWCAAFVALELGRTSDASELAGTYLGSDVAVSTPDELRALLLHSWDTSVGRLDFTSPPSLVFPILPPALSGLSTIAIRPQYGDPVLPGRQPDSAATTRDGRRHVLALATEWSSSLGGLSTFNRQLCGSLTAHARVTCVVLRATDEERRDATSAGVTLIEAPEAPGASDVDRLSRRPPLPEGTAPDVIIGHGRWTGPAAHHLGDDFPHAKRLHFLHVIPDDIERHKADRGVDAGVLAEERQEVELALSAEADHAVAVGPRMYYWFLRDLEARGVDPARLIRFDPGFDLGVGPPRQPPQGRPWTVLLVGRTEDDRLKGLDLAARAFNLARRRRGAGTPRVELLVRGAPPETCSTLEDRMRGWAADASLPVRVRPYSTRAERLAADLRAASLLLMPSRAEGFGLVAVEAILAGTPVLVSSESGLGELLEERLGPEEAARIVVPTTGDDERDVENWSNAIHGALRKREAEFPGIAELRARLASELTWSTATATLLDRVLNTADTRPPAPRSPEESPYERPAAPRA